MDLFEYQARDIFEKHGVPVLAANIATTADEAEKAAATIGGKVVVKAQVKVGGRGKAGGVKLAENPQDAREKAGAILGMDIKGHTVRTVMIAAAAPIESEYYLAILLDRSNRTFLVMASVSGGMDIEEVAHTAPEKLAKIPVSAVDGISLAKAKEIVAAAQFPADVADQVADVLVKLWETFSSEDATLVEVNPLVKTKDGKVIATRDFSAKDGSAYTTFFDQKGNKVSEGKEVNKLYDGEWKYYHFESKEIMSTENYSKGKLNGVKKVFYKNGKIAEETTYVNGIKNGPYKKYYEKGDVFEDATYKNDQFDGPVTYNDGAGKSIKGQFKDGKKSGIWKYYTNGKLTKEENPNKAKKEKFKIDSKNKGARKQKQNQPKG